MLNLLVGLVLTGMPQAQSLDDQRRALESALRHNPDHVATLLALGDVHLAWPTIGRYRAWRLYRRAAELAPDDPEPRYRQMLVGLHLGGDDGERMMRDAILEILTLRPDYRNIWAVWSRLYHGDGHRRRAIERLAAFDDAVAGRRRAAELIELERYDAARQLLDTLEARWPDDPAFPALAARAALEAGDGTAGRLAYARAVAASERDTAHVLWHQVEAIASPEEEGRYWALAPEDRPAFFRGFWDKREPDLTTPVNERLGEHFSRLRIARDQYRILHPQSQFHRSPGWRTLMGGFAGTVASTPARAGFPAEAVRGRSMFSDELSRAGVGIDVRDLPEPDSVTRYQRHGLDGRGLIYLRFGEPERRYVDRQHMEVETWAYRVDGRPVALTFARASAGAVFSGGSVLAGGDFVVYPTNPVELHNSSVMLEQDATAIPAPITLHAWVAAFRGDRDGWQDVLVAADADTVAAAAWDRTGVLMARATSGSPARLELPAGTYGFGVDGRRDGRLGRVRGPLVVPRLGGWLSLSSILIVPGTDTVGGRDELARRMPPDLSIARQDSPITIYAELYDLPPREGAVHYTVTYAFESDRAPLVFSFVRRRPAQSTVIERLILQPGDIPAGTYRVTLRIDDMVLGLRSSTTRLAVELR